MAFECLCEKLGRLFEPYVIHTLPLLLSAFGDSAPAVREAAADAARAIMGQLSACERAPERAAAPPAGIGRALPFLRPSPRGAGGRRGRELQPPRCRPHCSLGRGWETPARPSSLYHSTSPPPNPHNPPMPPPQPA
jgi:hypothetical protein